MADTPPMILTSIPKFKTVSGFAYQDELTLHIEIKHGNGPKL